MHDREFVLTWWAGLVRDSFGPGSVFHVARFGSLRIVWAADRRRKSVGSRRPPPPSQIDVQRACVRLLVPITKLCALVGGLLKRLNRSENA